MQKGAANEERKSSREIADENIKARIEAAFMAGSTHPKCKLEVTPSSTRNERSST
jgi:hypothetical protein